MSQSIIRLILFSQYALKLYGLLSEGHVMTAYLVKVYSTKFLNFSSYPSTFLQMDQFSYRGSHCVMMKMYPDNFIKLT